MTEQITLEKALKLVTFTLAPDGNWRIIHVLDDVYGNVHGVIKGNVKGEVFGDVNGTVWGNVVGNVRNVCGSVRGSVYGDVNGYVKGTVYGTINGKEWRSIETPKDKLKRLIEEGADKEQLLEAFNQLEDN